MSEIFTWIIFFIFFFFLELVYFKAALRFRIIDKPNDRSSHANFTIRGGGAIFPVAVICWSLLVPYPPFYFIAGLLMISVVSFIDDMEHIPTSVRFVFQMIALTLMLYQLQPDFSWYWLLLILFILIGTVNAYNFMDGINGITGLYSISVLVPLLYLNSTVHFIDQGIFISVLLSLFVFGFFNFRKKAKCFAGDIGSISMAFIICFLLLLLLIKTGNFSYILFLLIYGLDASTTLFFRILRRENIFEAHRTHFYQYLANELRWDHLKVSSLYAILQLVLNVVLIALPASVHRSLTFVILTVLILFAAVMLLRIKIEGKRRLMKAESGKQKAEG